MKEKIVMWNFVTSIIIMGCLSINCYNNKATEKSVTYLEKIEKEGYIIQEDATKLPNWPDYRESVIRYNESEGAFFGSSLLRYGAGPRSSDQKGFYLDVTPNHEYALFFEEFTGDTRVETQWSCILVKKSRFLQTIELLIPYDDIYRVFHEGRYTVYGFRNQELILKHLCWL
jgi:hypothetical protein